jgi:hypothetical protein
MGAQIVSIYVGGRDENFIPSKLFSFLAVRSNNFDPDVFIAGKELRNG